MKFNRWTLALAGAGVISLGSAAQAEEQNQVLTALSQTQLSGYVDTSAIWALNGEEGSIPGRSFDGSRDKLGGFNLHAVKLVLEKPLDEGQWSAGYKADLVFGPDASYYGTVVDRQAGPGGDFDDFAVKQAYVALRAPVGNGLDIKMGVWDTLIGYEVFESGNNPNFSRSYGYFLEPTHHTGVLLSYHINDMLSVSGGLANGWGGPVNDKNFHSSNLAYLGSLTITLPEATGMFAGSSVYLGFVHGETSTYISSGMTALDSPEITSYYAGATVASPVEGLSFGAAVDYAEDIPGAFTAGGYAWAAALYASFQATEKLRLNARADYTRASDGVFYTIGVPGLVPADHNELGSLTLTGDYSLWANVLTRAELRWDHAMSGDKPFPGQDGDIVTFAANFLYKF